MIGVYTHRKEEMKVEMEMENKNHVEFGDYRINESRLIQQTMNDWLQVNNNPIDWCESEIVKIAMIIMAIHLNIEIDDFWQWGGNVCN